MQVSSLFLLQTVVYKIEWCLFSQTSVGWFTLFVLMYHSFPCRRPPAAFFSHLRGYILLCLTCSISKDGFTQHSPSYRGFASMSICSHNCTHNSYSLDANVRGTWLPTPIHIIFLALLKYIMKTYYFWKERLKLQAEIVHFNKVTHTVREMLLELYYGKQQQTR